MAATIRVRHHSGPQSNRRYIGLGDGLEVTRRVGDTANHAFDVEGLTELMPVDVSGTADRRRVTAILAVLSGRDRAKVVGIHAGSISANMVDFHAVGDRPKMQCVRVSVGRDVDTVDVEFPVAAMQGPCPEPAGISPIYLLPKPFVGMHTPQANGRIQWPSCSFPFVMHQAQPSSRSSAVTFGRAAYKLGHIDSSIVGLILGAFTAPARFYFTKVIACLV